MKVKKFHQFIRVEKGPVNTALIDLLKGSVYQVGNEKITALEQGRYEEISDFIESANSENLIIDIDERCWIPTAGESRENRYQDDELNIELHVEESTNLETLLKKLADHPIYRVVVYGKKLPHVSLRQVKIILKEKDFGKCVKKACINGEFTRITDSAYKFNKKYNSCWGEKVAITGDGKVRPCIYSSISVGDIYKDDADEILEKMVKYWFITKDMVEKCKDCELRHVCFDCREISRRKGGNLFSAPPACNYDPYKGTWNS